MTSQTAHITDRNYTTPAFGEWAVYECDRLMLGQTPQNEREVVSGFSTPGDAREWANAMKRANRAKSYVVGPRA